MANNYLEFSEALTNLTEAEEAWLREQLQTVRVFGEKEYVEDAVPAELADMEPDWSGIRFLRDMDDQEMCDCVDFEYSFHDPHEIESWGRHLWVYSGEGGNPGNVAHLVQKFHKKFRHDQCWTLTYATTCSKPRVGAFAGGAIFVTADAIKWQDAYDFVEQERAAFEARKHPSHQMEE